jgi:chemotaxis protein MotB
MLNKFLITIFIIAGASSGCVTKAKYTDAQDNITGLKTQIADLESQLNQNKTLTDQLEQKLGTATSDKVSMQLSIEEMKQALAELAKRKQETEKRVKDYNALIKKFKALTDTGKLKIKIVEGRMVVVLPSDVLFSSGSARLSEAGVNTIKEVGKLLSSLTDKKFQIEGHTDNVPIRSSTYPSNWELASARALTVTKFMLDAGLKGENISAASFGEFKPAASNENVVGKALNRRIEIVIVPDLSKLPGYDELNSLSGDE